MFKYVLKRLGLALVTACIVLSLTFICVKLLPFQMPLGNDLEKLSYFLRESVLGFVIDSPVEIKKYGEALWNYRDSLGVQHYFYETPVMQQYFSWIKNIVTKWEWGTSRVIEPNLSASTIIMKRLPTSVSINIIATLISVPLGILLGIIAALKKNTKTDHIISTSVMVFISIPSFVLITFILLIFAYNLEWLPTQWPFDTDPLSYRIKGYVIPVVCLSFGSICGYCRFVRAELCEVMSSEYLLLARTKGLTKKQAILRHALRNAMVPIVPAILAEFIGVLGGSMILEGLYGIDGIGSLFIDALNLKDFNVLFVDMAVFTTIGLLSGVFLDISYGFIDPRIRMGAKK